MSMRLSLRRTLVLLDSLLSTKQSCRVLVHLHQKNILHTDDDKAMAAEVSRYTRICCTSVRRNGSLIVWFSTAHHPSQMFQTISKKNYHNFAHLKYL